MSNISRLMNLAAAGAGGGSYWISLLGGTGSDIANGVTIDSSDNIIVVGYTDDGGGGQDALIAQYNSSGILQWDRTLAGTSSDIANGVAVDSSDNIIVGASTSSDGAGSADALIAKYNSSGVLQWDRTLGGTSSDYANGVTIDSSDNIIIAGRCSSDGAGGADFLIAKYNPSGVLQWDKTLGGTGTDIANGVTIDSSDNIIVVGQSNSDGSFYDVIVAKYNSSGVLQWDKVYGVNGSHNEIGYGVATDSSDNIIIVGTTPAAGAGSNDAFIAKYNSSGVLQWGRVLGGTGYEIGYGVATDSSDNIIVVGRTDSDGAGTNDFLIAQYNSSGVLQWDRTLGGTGQEVGNDVAIDSSDNIIVVGRTDSDGAGSNDAFIAKLPSDGSLEGTYGAYTYAEAVLTDAAAGLPSAAAGLTDAAAVLTDAPAVLTDAPAGLTEELIEL